MHAEDTLNGNNKKIAAEREMPRIDNQSKQLIDKLAQRYSWIAHQFDMGTTP